MIAKETKLKGCFIIEPKVFEDERGYFFESFNAQNFNKALGQEISFVQDNQSYSKKGVLRGLHYQTGEYAQAKLVKVIKGSVLDVVVDLRKNSATYGEHLVLELSAKNKRQVFIPRGFGHGFVVLSDTAEFFYKCDNYYNKDYEAGIIYDDIDLNINWRMPECDLVLSQKDLELPSLKDMVL